MKEWGIRLGILLLVPVLLAFVDSRVRPVTLSSSEDKAPVAAEEETSTPEEVEAKVQEELAFVEEHFNNATAIFIDARPLDQYEAGHIPGAFHLAFGEFVRGRPQVLDYLPLDMLIIVYCEGGDCDSSHKVAEMLSDFGYEQVDVFQAGYPGWVEAGFPIEEGPPAF